MTTQQYKAMCTAMEEEGWMPLRDVFGGIYAWRFKLTGKTIPNKIVEQYWITHGRTPMPF